MFPFELLYVNMYSVFFLSKFFASSRRKIYIGRILSNSFNGYIGENFSIVYGDRIDALTPDAWRQLRPM